MNFVDYSFLFIFLPILLVVYYGTSRYRDGNLEPPRGRGRLLLLTIASYIFYAWWRVDFLGLLLFTTILDYNCAYAIHQASDKLKKRAWLTLSITCNLLVLGYFKYFNFGIESANHLLVWSRFEPIRYTKVFLPIGISFYTFESISYTVDVYRREIYPAPSLLHYAGFIAFFPHLIAGPIIRYRDIGPQLVGAKHELSKCCRGVMLFIIGFGKKLLIADSVAPVANAVFDGSRHGALDAWLGLFAFTMQLYFDFSGYSDMAMGLANLFGFDFPQNFDAPYRSASITEFWRRWHMSLSRWLRDYLYIPLGGNQKGEVRTYFNLFVTMVLGGLWHGANWTFVCWGAFHGILLSAERMRGKREFIAFPIRWMNVGFTFILVMIGWAIFRAPDMDSLGEVLKGMFGFYSYSDINSLLPYLRPTAICALCAAPLIVAFAPQSILFVKNINTLKAFLLGGIFLLSLLKMIFSTQRTFLYFQF